jgi:hypothetical protein
MKKSKMVVDNSLLDTITNSLVLDERQKIEFLKYVWYLTLSERKELLSII